MTRARDIADVQDNLGGAVAPYVAGKNAIINGGMDIWQRSTSSASSSAYYTADRWFQIAAGTTTVSQDTDIPSGVPVQYSIKWVTSASSSYGQFYQMVEQANVIPLRGQTMTASAYLKTSGTAYAGNLILRIDYNITSDTFSGGSWVNLSDTFFTGSSITSWTRKTGTFTIPSNAIGLRFTLIPDTVQSSGVTVKMAAAQLEIGSIATPFARAGGSIGGELALCQRYYHQINSPNNIPFVFQGNATMFASVALPVAMRTQPTGTSNINSFTTGTPTATGIFLDAYYVGRLTGTYSSVVVYTTTANNIGNVQLYSWSGYTTGLPYLIGSGNSAYFAWSAEL
jgi:hypothetical protein